MTKKILTVFLMAGMLMGSSLVVNANPNIEIVSLDFIQPTITYANGSLHVVGAAGQVVVVYNIVGQKVFEAKIDSNDKRFDLSLPSNCYIVKVGNVARKISIKR